MLADGGSKGLPKGQPKGLPKEKTETGPTPGCEQANGSGKQTITHKATPEFFICYVYCAPLVEQKSPPSAWYPLPLQRLPLEHRGDRELEAVLLPKDLVEIVIVAHTRVINHAVSDLGELLRQEAVRRGDDLVKVRRNLRTKTQGSRTP